MKKILMYCEKNGKSPVLEFLKKGDEKIREKLNYQIKMLQNGGQMLCEPHVKHFMIEKYRMFYEFRIKVSGKVVRIIFCERGGNIILLHAFYKHDKRDTENALDYTLNLLKKLDDEVLMPYERLCEVDNL